jgi:pimeloyl-ACP methyl ester carboxylesterase
MPGLLCYPTSQLHRLHHPPERNIRSVQTVVVPEAGHALNILAGHPFEQAMLKFMENF